METRDRSDDDQPSRRGYIAAIVISAVGHAALAVLVFFVLPRYLNASRVGPESYSVKIVGELPAGDLGTHLPKLSSEANPPEESKPPPEQPKPQEAKVVPRNEPPPPAADDKNAIALNTLHTPTPTPESLPTPAPAATAEPTTTPGPAATAEPTSIPTPIATATPPPEPTRTPEPASTATPRPKPRPRATPKQSERRKPRPKPSAVMVAKAEHTPSVQERLNKLREKLMAEHLAQEKEDEASEDEKAKPETAESGGGPVAANRATEGGGNGVGPGEIGGGIQQDPEFLLYYQTVQDRVKKAWSFSGGNSELTTTVSFAIGPDGNLTGVKITHSSLDSAFDDSVIRAIRHAAPFPPPPGKYRSQFAEGVEAVFKLGELSS